MVADALIYHPAITHYNKFVSTTVGRDKALRTVQYFSRFLAFYLLRTNHSASSIATFTALKANLGLVRKCLRLGKFVEHFRAAAVASDSKTLHPVLKTLATGRQLGYAFYLLLDAGTYLDAAGIRKSVVAKKLQREAYRAWAVGIACSILSGGWSLWMIQSQATGQAEDAEKVVEEKRLVREKKAVYEQLLSDVCDITAPISALGWVDLDDGIVGLAGTLSSLMALRNQWNKTA